MKRIIFFILMFFACIVVLSQFSFSETDEDNTRPEQQDIELQKEEIKPNNKLIKEKKSSTYQKIDPKTQEAATLIDYPVYKPPLRGAPVGRIAGGTRANQGEAPFLLCVLTPDHTSLTTQEQPILYYFIKELVSFPIELTISAAQSTEPILKTSISSPEVRGIQSIYLRDYDIFLQKNMVYKWFVAIIQDPDHRSNDILAWGAIERIDLPKNVSQKLAQSEKTHAPHIYASAGIWYDALSEFSSLIKLYPNNLVFRKYRSALLEQVGLRQVAIYDMQ